MDNGIGIIGLIILIGLIVLFNKYKPKCPDCGRRDGWYRIAGDNYCKYCSGPEEQMLDHLIGHHETKEEREKRIDIETINANTCPSCRHFSPDLKYDKRILRTERVNGRTRSYVEYSKKCKNCLNVFDQRFDWE